MPPRHAPWRRGRSSVPARSPTAMRRPAARASPSGGGGGTTLVPARAPTREAPPGSSATAEGGGREPTAPGKPATPFMKFGDHVRIEMFDRAGQSIFGAIDQKVVKYDPPG